MSAIVISYCQGWNYAPKARAAKQHIESHCPGVSVTIEPTPTVSGAFEVKNSTSGKLYWSKLGGAGFPDTDGLKKICDAINADK